MTTPKRWSLGTGIYQDAHGITVQARIGSGATLETSPPVRFPLIDADGDPYTRRNNRELVECYLRLRAALVDARRVHGGTDSVRAAIETFLAEHPVVKGAPTSQRHADLKTELTPWLASPIAPLPITTPIKTLRPLIARVLETWATTPRAAGKAPYAASTVNRRKYALAAVLASRLPADDAGVQNLPTDKIPDQVAAKRAPRGIDLAIIARILDAIPNVGRARPGQPRPPYSENKIRLRIMAWTGLTRISLVRLTRKRVDFANGRIFYPPREKGSGAPGLWIDLLPPALDAFKDYDAAKLWGTNPSRSSQHSAWARAVATTRAALETAAAAEPEPDGVAHRMLAQFTIAVPANCHPYDLRHSFGTDNYARGRDIYATKATMQHKRIETTEQYLGAAVPEAVAAAIDKMRAYWFPDAPKPGATVRDFQLVTKTRV